MPLAGDVIFLNLHLVTLLDAPEAEGIFARSSRCPVGSLSGEQAYFFVN